MKTARIVTILFFALSLMVCWTNISLGKKPVSSEFTYHGRLAKQSGPASGLYDFLCVLFDDPCSAADANRIGPIVEVNDLDVQGGQFRLSLDFGNDPNVFNGDKRWLAIEVREGDLTDPCDYTILDPRIELTAAPYASTAVRISGMKVVKNEHLEDRAVGRDKIKDRAVGREKIEDRAVDPNKIDHKAVKKEHIADKAVGREKIEDRAVDPNKIDHKAVKKEHIADKAVGREKIEDRAVDPNKIDHKAVKKEHIADKAVGREKIEDQAVDPNKLADKAVTSSKIADGSIMFSHIAQNGAGEGQVMKWNAGAWIAADDLTETSVWTTSGNYIYSPAAYNVGIGTGIPSSPPAKLTVAGSILRFGSTMYGTYTEDHINLGTNSYTGTGSLAEPAFPTVSGGDNNHATAKASTVGGGLSNTAGNDRATVAGGGNNYASGVATTVSGGSGNTASGGSSTVGGGSNNEASGGSGATVGGGTDNTAGRDYATVAGGITNSATEYGATVAGGSDNHATGDRATIGGGYSNTAAGFASTVPGGRQNSAEGAFSFAAGFKAKANHNGSFVWADSNLTDFASTNNNQFLIRASGGVGIGTTSPAAQLTVNGAILRHGSTMHGTSTTTHINLGTNSTTGTPGEDYLYATVNGGNNNTASGQASTVGGGFENTAGGERVTVAGGANNSAFNSVSTVGGGQSNTANGGYATVSGGFSNTADGQAATIGGGYSNTTNNPSSTIGGGQNNTANGSYTTVSGGFDNSAGGLCATVPGGRENNASGAFSFAAGLKAKANHDGSFVWADSNTLVNFASTNDNQFLIRASGGVGIGTNNPSGQLDVNGSIYQRGGLLHADYVFEPGYELDSIEEHSEFMWGQKHLPAVPKARTDENGREIVEVGAHRKGILEELEKAHIYIEQLHNRLKTLEARDAEIEALKKHNKQIETRLLEMQSLLSNLISPQEGGGK